MIIFSFILQTATYENGPQSSVLNNSLTIVSRFPDINLNPVVVLENILKKTDTIRHVQSERECLREPFVEQQDQHNTRNEKDNEIIEYILPNDDEPMAQNNTIRIKDVGTKSELIQKSDDENTVENMEQSDEHINAEKLVNERSEMESQNETEHKCKDCGRKFRTQIAIDYHVSRFHSGTGKCVCKICKKEFSMITALYSHMSYAHDPNARKHKCKCGSVFRTRVELQRHNDSIHLNIRKFKCQQCKKAFTCQARLTEHERIHSGERPFQCRFEHCDKGFVTRSSQRWHERLHTGEKPYRCDIDRCKQSFTDITHLKMHKDKEHGMSTLRYPCQICSKIFNMKKELMKHIEKKHSTSEGCSIEQQPIQQAQQSREQSIISSHHKDIGVALRQLDIKIEELLIGSRTNELHNQQEISHESNGSDEIIIAQNSTESSEMHSNAASKKFACDVCKKEFIMDRYLRAHVKRQHGSNTKSFKCEKCPNFFARQRQLQMHIESVHLNIRKHKCNTCGKSFKYSHHLKDHIIIHTGERPFICSYEQCDKRFINHHKKVQHERIHTGEAVFVCKIDGCGKAFSDKNNLNDHTNNEHGMNVDIQK